MIFAAGAPMTVARWPNAMNATDAGNSTSLNWARTVTGSGGGGVNQMSREERAKILNVSTAMPLGAVHHGYKPKRKGSCSQLKLKRGISCEEQARPVREANRANRAAWARAKGMPLKANKGKKPSLKKMKMKKPI
jgi:hypothetical protein